MWVLLSDFSRFILVLKIRESIQPQLPVILIIYNFNIQLKSFQNAGVYLPELLFTVLLQPITAGHPQTSQSRSDRSPPRLLSDCHLLPTLPRLISLLILLTTPLLTPLTP